MGEGTAGLGTDRPVAPDNLREGGEGGWGHLIQTSPASPRVLSGRPLAGQKQASGQICRR